MASKSKKVPPPSKYTRLTGSWCKRVQGFYGPYWDWVNPVELIGQNGYFGHIKRDLVGDLTVFVVTTGPRKGVWANEADLGR